MKGMVYGTRNLQERANCITKGEGEGIGTDMEGQWADMDWDGMEDTFSAQHYVDTDGDGIIGNPGSAMESWHPQTGNTCAAVSQEFAIEGILGQEFVEGDLREIAEDNGWYDNGTSMEDVGKILEY